MKSDKFKMRYAVVESSMKAAEKAIEGMELESPEVSPEHSTSSSLNTKRPVVDETIPMGEGKWDYYYKKTGSGQYQSGEIDSIVPGNGNAPDTNFHRTYSQPKVPKKDIPNKN